MFYINNAFLHLELSKSEQISISRGKHIKNTCCPICRQAVPSFSCHSTQRRVFSCPVFRQPSMHVATLGQRIARLAIPRRSPDGDDRSGCGIFAVVANRRCQDSVGIDRPCQLARRREGPTEAIQPADYRQPQGASPPPGLRRHVLCPHPKKERGEGQKVEGSGGPG